jgi:hypothetical protein
MATKPSAKKSQTEAAIAWHNKVQTSTQNGTTHQQNLNRSINVSCVDLSIQHFVLN